jgi:hypothetical protein
MAVIIGGDLHLSDERQWSYEVSKKIVAYIATHSSNNPDNILILEGDLPERAFISGQVIDLIHSLFLSLKYAKTYIIKGNHDTKLNKVGQETLVYEYINSDPQFRNIHIIEQPTILDYDDMKFLMLPHKLPDGTISNKDYEHLDSKFTDHTYTAVLGHFSDTSIPIPGETIDISYLKTKYTTLGHYHIPSENYIGSIVPNSTKEAGYPRHFIKFESGIRTYLPIEPILEYVSVSYPDSLPVKAAINVYTIYNCSDMAVARQQYGPDVYIKEAIMAQRGATAGSISIGGGIDLSTDKTYSELFMEYMAQETKYSPEIMNKALKYL